MIDDDYYKLEKIKACYNRNFSYLQLVIRLELKSLLVEGSSALELDAYPVQVRTA
jgi:hypothetical protein